MLQRQIESEVSRQQVKWTKGNTHNLANQKGRFQVSRQLIKKKGGTYTLERGQKTVIQWTGQTRGTHILVSRDKEVSKQKIEKSNSTHILVSIDKVKRDQQTVNMTNKGHNPQAGKRRQGERGQRQWKEWMRNDTHKLANREWGQEGQQIE